MPRTLLLSVLAILAIGLGRPWPSRQSSATEPKARTGAVDVVTEWGLPTTALQLTIGKARAEIDPQTRLAAYVLQYITREDLAGDAERSNRFYADERVPEEFRATNRDYEGSGDDRGHMDAAQNHGRQRAKDATFSLANMLPEHHLLNIGPVKASETWVVDQVRKRGQLWVVTGPAWLAPRGGEIHVRTLGPNRLWRPTHVYKSTLGLNEDGTIVLKSWLFPNTAPRDGWELDDYAVCVDEIEDVINRDLWSAIDDAEEAELEAVK